MLRKYLKLLHLCIFLCTGYYTQSQVVFAGGDGGGSGNSLFASLLEIPGLTGVFSGGDGRGDTRAIFFQVFQNTATKGVYTGGKGKGDAYGQFISGLPNERI